MMKRNLSQIINVLLTLFMLLAVTSCSYSKKKPRNHFGSWDDDEPTRPKVGLVLGGGGAKCAAEIGVLKKLKEMDINIDCIAGSSMGAVVGSLYAAGYSPDEIEEFMCNEKWMWIYDREHMSLLNLIKDNSKDSYHWSGLIRRPLFRDSLYAKLEQRNCRLFEKLKIPFCCTAYYIDKHKDSLFVFKEGVVANGVTASISHPIYLTPWNHEGKLFYDGGMWDNLPVNVIRQMDPKPDIIIAIDVENDDNILNNGVPVDELLAIISNVTDMPVLGLIDEITPFIPYADPIMKWIKNRDDETRRKEVIRESETNDSLIYIHVKLDDLYDITSFGSSECKDMVGRGYSATEAKMSEIEKVLKKPK